MAHIDATSDATISPSSCSSCSSLPTPPSTFLLPPFPQSRERSLYLLPFLFALADFGFFHLLLDLLPCGFPPLAMSDFAFVAGQRGRAGRVLGIAADGAGDGAGCRAGVGRVV